MIYKNLITRPSPKIIGIGLNYLSHINQMSLENPQEPVVFSKPWSSLVYNPKQLSLPFANKSRIDHELELGVFIKKSGKNISIENSMDHVGGYFLVNDITDRDLQSVAMKKGLPWTISKGQDNFCPISQFIKQQINPYQMQLELLVNQKVRQKDLTSNMYFKIDKLISFVSFLMTLNEGDLILTGTPKGVGPLKIGDKVQGFGRIKGKIVSQLSFQVTK